MKLTREDFRNYIKDYCDDEIFYRDLYFQEKNHPETFHEYCLNLDRQFISNHRLFVPELQKEAWYPYMQEKDLFGDLTGNIMFSKHYRYTPIMSMSFLKSSAYITEPPIQQSREWLMNSIPEISASYRLIPRTVSEFLMTVSLLIFWSVALLSSPLFSSH